jgi:uncharacterized protein YhhL (DUF1145 family)
LDSDGDSFLPDLCRGQGLPALLITMADSGLPYFDWVKLAKVSLLSLWTALLSAVVLCFANLFLSATHHVTAAFTSFLLILQVMLFCGATSETLMWWYSAPLVNREYNVWNVFE